MSLRSASLPHVPILCGQPEGRAMVAHGNSLVKEQDKAYVEQIWCSQEKRTAGLSVNSRRKPQTCADSALPLAHNSKTTYKNPKIPHSDNNPYAPLPTDHCRSGETAGRRTISYPSRSAARQPKGKTEAGVSPEWGIVLDPLPGT